MYRPRGNEMKILILFTIGTVIALVVLKCLIWLGAWLADGEGGAGY
jgi:hypothetical protein